MLEGLILRHGSVGSVGVDNAGDDGRTLDHRGLVCRLIDCVLLNLSGGLGVVLGKQLRQEVVRTGRAERGDLANTGDAARTLGKVTLAVGEADGAVVAVDLHKTAQIHRLPNVVLGLTLDLDAEAGIVAVLFLGGVEHDDDILLKLIEAVVHQPDKFFADEAVALEGETAVALAILRVFLDGPQGHEGDQLAAGIENQRVEVLKVDRGEITEDFIVALGLDVRLAVARLDAVDTEVNVDVQGIGSGQRQRGFANAGVSGNQHTDLLRALLDIVRVSDHCDSSFQLVAASRRRVITSWQRRSKFPLRYISVCLKCSSSYTLEQFSRPSVLSGW